MSAQPNIGRNASQPRYAWVVMPHLWAMDQVNNLIFFSLGVMVPIWKDELSLTPTQAGLMGTVGFFGFGLMALPASIWLTRYSPKLITLLCCLGMAASTLIQALAPGALLLMLGRFLFVMLAAARTQIQVMFIQQWFRPRLYASINSLDFGNRSMGQTLSLAAAPALILLLGGWRGYYHMAAAMLLLITLSWVFLGRENRAERVEGAPPPPEINPAGVLRRHKSLWVVASAQVGVAICFGAILTFYPTYSIDKLNISLETAGLLMSAFPVGGIVGTLSSGPLSQWMGRRKPFIWVPGLILPASYLLLLQAIERPTSRAVPLHRRRLRDGCASRALHHPHGHAPHTPRGRRGARALCAPFSLSAQCGARSSSGSWRKRLVRSSLACLSLRRSTSPSSSTAFSCRRQAFAAALTAFAPPGPRRLPRGPKQTASPDLPCPTRERPLP